MYEQAQGNAEEAFYIRLFCLGMLFSALEAYANHLGTILRPDTWAKERQFFRKPSYEEGTLGKLKYLAKECKLPPFNEQSQPYSTIKELRDTRHFLAHGRTKIVEEEIAHDPQEMPKAAAMFLDKHAAKVQLKQALEDVEQVIRTLHQAAQSAFRKNRGIKLDLDLLIGTERLEIGSSKS